MKLRFSLLLALLFILEAISGQSYLQQFFQLSSKNDTVGELVLLNKWESSNKEDPDLFIAWFNFYFQKSMKEVIRLDTDTTKQNGFKITNPTSQKRVGSMYGDIFYDPELVSKSIQYIEILSK